MAYKFQLGAARLSGSLVQEGQIKAESAAISGSSLGVNGTTATVFGISVLGAANQSAAQNVMGLRPGTEVQAFDAQLTELGTMNANTAEALADLLNTEVQILDGATVSTAELNLIDGGTSRTTNVPADGDGFLHNNNGTMEMTTVDKLVEYVLPKITGGDVAVASNGTATIQATSVEGSMLNANVAGDGVTVVSNAIKLDLNASGGIDLSGPGGQAGIKLDTNPGLELGSGGLKVKRDGSSINTGPNGLSVNAVQLAGLGVIENSGKLDIRTFNSGGIDTNGPDGAVQIKLTDTQGLSLSATGLDLNDTIGGNRTFSNDITIEGTLTVAGTTTSVNSTNLVVNDNLIQLNAVTGSEGRTSNSGAGIFITGSLANGNNDVSLTCNADGGELKSSSGFDVATGKTYQINGSDVLSATALASSVLVDGDSLRINNCANTLTNVSLADADLFIVDDNAAGDPKKITAGNLKTFFQEGVSASSASKIRRTVDSSSGDDMSIGQDGGVNYFALTASATAVIDPGFSVGHELNIKAGPLVSESVVLTISGAAGANYSFDGSQTLQLESPNASIKLILRNVNDWMIF